jgi:hypothetical protein
MGRPWSPWLTDCTSWLRSSSSCHPAILAVCESMQLMMPVPAEGTRRPPLREDPWGLAGTLPALARPARAAPSARQRLVGAKSRPPLTPEQSGNAYRAPTSIAPVLMVRTARRHAIPRVRSRRAHAWHPAQTHTGLAVPPACPTLLPPRVGAMAPQVRPTPLFCKVRLWRRAA